MKESSLVLLPDAMLVVVLVWGVLRLAVLELPRLREASPLVMSLGVGDLVLSRVALEVIRPVASYQRR